ncbi:hypothetical protein JCM5353_005664 [Sporobolomyces roseus]
MSSSLSLPVPPPRHPSSRPHSPHRNPSPAPSPSQELPRPSYDRLSTSSPPLPEPRGVQSDLRSSQTAVPSTSRPTTPTPAATTAPPKHPYVESRIVDADSDETSRKLADIEDQEIAEMLDRVGGRLQELRVTADDEREPLEYPEKEAFRDEQGRIDWVSYTIAYASLLIVTYTPPSLIGHPPRDEFSVRFLRDDLSRLYVLCPPSVWQGYLLGDLAELYRWENTTRTGKAAAAYACLWFFDLVPLFPIGLLIYYMLRPRLLPPTVEELLANSTERASRTREAAELSKQLKNSSAGRGLGFAAEGVRGVFGDLKDKLPIGRSSGEERNLASALGSTALLGGIAGSGGNYQDALRQRLGKSADEISIAPSETSPPSTPQVGNNGTSREDYEDSPATDKMGDVSLYRLLRNLSHSFGPPAQTLLNETIDLLEMLRNVMQHPDHPSSLPVLLRLIAIFFVILLTPTWLRLKSIFGYLGVEFFVLWKLRELYPEWRRATMMQWWILAGAPTDADYALYILRKRGAEGRAIRGSKTIKRMARKERSRASSSADQTADKYRGVHRIAKSISDNASIHSVASHLGTDSPINTFFALHRSVPGQLVLSSSSIRFVPAKKLQKLGFHKLVARAAKKWGDSSIELDESYYHSDSDRDSLLSFDDATTSTSEGGGVKREGKEMEMVLRVGEIEKVKKDRQYRLPALEITGKNGQVWKFSNVSRRDDAFNKILSFSAVPWKKA